MSNFGGRMRGVEQIRADGVAPVAVPDARQQAYKSGPKTQRPCQCFSAQRGVHQAKNARGLGRFPGVLAARSAAGLVFLGRGSSD